MSSNIEVKLDVLNQKASPALYAAPLANRPAASFTGRLFVDSDSPSTGIYRDTGTTWVQVADQGAGTTGTLQQVTTNGNTTSIGISVTANGIGIGVAAPAANLLDIHGTTGVLAQLENTTTQNSLLSFRNQGSGIWSIGNSYSGNLNDFIIYDAQQFKNLFTLRSSTNKLTLDVALQVNSSIRSDIGSGSGSSFIANGGNSNFQVSHDSTQNVTLYNSSGGGWYIKTLTGTPIFISSSNRTIINSITDIGFQFQVTGTAYFSNSITWGQTSGTYMYAGGSTHKLIYSANGTNNFYSGGTNGFTVANQADTTILFNIADAGTATFNFPVNIGNSVAAGVAVASTHKVSILIGGVQYYLLASNI